MFALAVMSPVFACSDAEFKAIRSPDPLIYLIHSIDDILNVSSSRQVLLKMMLHGEQHFPRLFNSSAWKQAYKTLDRKNQLTLCGNARETFDTQLLLSPAGPTAIGVLYGCNIKTKVKTQIIIYDKTQEESKQLVFNQQLWELSVELRSEICGCGDMADRFIQECVRNF